MELEQQREMAEMLYAETKANRLNWQEAGENKYRLSFPQSSLLLSYGPAIVGVVLHILNKDGIEVDFIAENVLLIPPKGTPSNNDVLEKLREIYNLLRSRSRHEEETINDIMTRLRSSAAGGKLQKPPPPNMRS